MTRLAEQDICYIVERLERYDKILRDKTGGGLMDIAAFAVDAAAADLRAAKAKQKIGIVPVTAGQGIIGGFSDTVRGILAFLGAQVFVTKATDVAGLAEATANGATAVFIADDQTCSLIDLRTGQVADNSLSTGKGFAAALAMQAGSLQGKSVGLLGAGPVGYGAAQALTARGAHVYVYDCQAEPLRKFSSMDGVAVVDSAAAALAQSDYYFEATTASATIQVNDFCATTLVAAPGVPLGVTAEAMKCYGSRVISDTLEIGVATMLAVLLKGKQTT
jgi:3-methylornithyl-N6-L-lysine dehydrogenase